MSKESDIQQDPLCVDRFLSNHGLRPSPEGKILHEIVISESLIANHCNPKTTFAASEAYLQRCAEHAEALRGELGLQGENLESLQRACDEMVATLEANKNE